MGLRQEQEQFLQDVALKLLPYIYQHGYTVTGGELSRTPEQQEIYYKTGRSKTLTGSNHLVRCAIDLNIFKDGNLCGYDDIHDIGTYWESLDPKNRWGGFFKKLVDTPHFERNVQ